MFWITENHFQFVSLFDWRKVETQTLSLSRNRDGFAFAESHTKKSATVTPLLWIVHCFKVPKVFSLLYIFTIAACFVTLTSKCTKLSQNIFIFSVLLF